MLVFIDESGDPGLKLKDGSSEFFVVSLVVFEDHEEALACDQRIELLKRELGWQYADEFHFKRNGDKVRESFITAVAPYGFFYYAIVLNKKNLQDNALRNKQSFYKYACGLVFEDAKEKLAGATVIIDKSGCLDFRRQLENYLKKQMNDRGGSKRIKRVKMERSESNNLLQLADYIAGIINRAVQNKKRNAQKFRKMIAHREIKVQIWPDIKSSQLYPRWGTRRKRHNSS